MLRRLTGKLLFQPEARGNNGGAAVETAADEEAAHPGENVEVHPQGYPQPEETKGDNENDKTEV
jgi:hypothetical protein